MPYVVYYDGTDSGRATVMSFVTLTVPISGSDTVCVGDTTTLFEDMPGCVWSSSNTIIATVGSLNGIVTGVSTGTVTITCSITGNYVTYAMNVVASCGDGVKKYSGSAVESILTSPIPNKGNFSINIASPVIECAKVIIYDLLGRKLKEFQVSTNCETAVELDEPPGVYFIGAVTSNGKLTEKIIIK